MEDLTLSDIDILTDSLSLWEKKMPPGLMAQSMAGLATALESDNREEGVAKVDEIEKRVHEMERARMESSALLKAKLIAIKNHLMAEAL